MARIPQATPSGYIYDAVDIASFMYNSARISSIDAWIKINVVS